MSPKQCQIVNTPSGKSCPRFTLSLILAAFDMKTVPQILYSAGSVGRAPVPWCFSPFLVSPTEILLEQQLENDKIQGKSNCDALQKFNVSWRMASFYKELR